MERITLTKEKIVAEDIELGTGTIEQTRGLGTKIFAGSIPYSSTETIKQSVDRKEDITANDAKLVLKADLNGSTTESFNVKPAVLDTEAPTKKQLDTELALKSDITYTDTQLALKADLNGSTTESFNVKPAVLDTEAPTKKQLDTELVLKSDVTYTDTQLALKADEANTLLKDGSSPTFSPVSSNQPATKKYVDDLLIDIGAGDMLKSIYDTGNTGAVDTAEAIGRVGTFLGKTPMDQIMRLAQSNVTDCNILDGFGIFIGTDVANAPTNGQIGLEQLDITSGKAQRCFSFNNNRWYDRTFNGSIWSGWAEWAEMSDVNSIDAAKVDRAGDTMTGELTINLAGGTSNVKIAYNAIWTNSDNYSIIPTTDIDKTLAIGDSGATYAAVNVKATDFTWNGVTIADKAYVDTENSTQDATIALKADKAYVDTENSTQDTTIALKADKTYVDSQDTAHAALRSSDTVYGHSKMSLSGSTLTITTT